MAFGSKTLLAIALTSVMSFAHAQDLPNVHILATGGTIAGTATTGTNTTGYNSANLGIQTLIDAVPEITKVADVQGEQVVKISSNNMTSEVMLKLAHRVNELLARDDVDGVVITHGTNTLEETAFFLHLTVKSDKPVVVVGAMRPATAISADGPMNLLEAVQVAASPKMKGMGVTVVMNDQISSARDVTKFSTTNPATFENLDMGYLGYVVHGEPVLYRKVIRRHTTDSEFDITNVKELPRVDIIYSHVDQDGLFFETALKHGAKGLVSVGTGNGGVSDAAFAVVQKARQDGIPVIWSSRPMKGGVVKSFPDYEAAGVTWGGNLNPQKCRILLQLALLKTNDPKEIQRIFDQY